MTIYIGYILCNIFQKYVLFYTEITQYAISNFRCTYLAMQLVTKSQILYNVYMTFSLLFNKYLFNCCANIYGLTHTESRTSRVSAKHRTHRCS